MVNEGGCSFLRYKGLDSGFWVAVPEESEDGMGWEVWWLQPSGATVEDFEGYVMVDVEVVKAEDGEREREREL